MSVGKPVDLDCPPWCVIDHVEDQEVQHASEVWGTAMSRYPFVSGKELCNTMTIATLNQEPYEGEPLVTVVVPDEDRRLFDEAEVKLTVDEAEQFANALLELVRTARSGSAADGQHDDVEAAFYAGHCGGQQGGDVTAQWQSYAKWKVEQEAR